MNTTYAVILAIFNVITGLHLSEVQLAIVVTVYILSAIAAMAYYFEVDKQPSMWGIALASSFIIPGIGLFMLPVLWFINQHRRFTIMYGDPKMIARKIVAKHNGV